MSVQTQIDRLASAKAAIKTAIEGKGVTVPDSALLDAYAALIESIEAGGGDVYYGTFTPASDTESFETDVTDAEVNVLAIFALGIDENNTMQSPLIIQSLPIGIALQIAGTPGEGTVYKRTTTNATFPNTQTANYFATFLNSTLNNKLRIYSARSSMYGHKFLAGITYFWVCAKAGG